MHVAREKIFLLTLGLTGFASSLAQRSTDPMVTAIAADFAAPIATVAMLSTSYALPYGLCQPILGPLGDVLGKSAVLKVCVALFAVALGLGAMAPSLDWLFGSRVIAGIAAGGVIPLALAMIGDRFEMSGRQVAISRFLSAAIIGQIVGVTSAGVLAETIGWRGAVWATSGAAALAAIGAFAGLKAEPADNKRDFRLSETFGRYGLVFANPRAAICYSAVFAEGVAIYGVPPYVAEMLEKAGTGGPSEAGFIIAGIGIGGIFFSIFVARLLSLLGAAGAMRTGGVLSGAGVALFGFTTTWVPGLVCFFAIGLGFFLLHSSLQSRATELAPSARGSAVALHAFFFFLGQGIAPAIFGWGYHHIGAKTSLILSALLMAAAGLISAQLLLRIDRRDAERKATAKA